LEKETNGALSKYKVWVNKQDSGIQFLYKLERGITNQAIALELLEKEGFDDDILQDAFAIINKNNL
ncbi:MAG: hypothetical protein V1855_00730, partial [bacterium]